LLQESIKQKIQKERISHAQRNQQKRREELIAKFRGLSAPQRKVALDLVEHAQSFFSEDLHPGGSTFTKPLINAMFHDVKYSTATDIANMIGKSENTVRNALKGKFKNNELKERAQRLGVKIPRLWEETNARALEAQDAIAPTKSGKGYVLLNIPTKRFMKNAKNFIQ
jgi:hypothetical protein